MQITAEQKDLLDSFRCERLSADTANEELIKSFTSKRGFLLVSYLKTLGLQEDASGKTTYYIIKNAEDEVMMFFSLKCGALFAPLQDENDVKRDLQRLLTLLQTIENVSADDAEAGQFAMIPSKYQVGVQISIEGFENLVLRKVSEKKKFLHQLFGDREKEQNNKIFRVQTTYPAIELVHFCTNDNLKEKWKSYGLGRSMGATLYWWFIAPKFFEVQEIAGCEFAFLFAADLSEDGSLVNYYDVSLKFQKRQDVGANKPFYDFCCDFMCQEVNEIKKKREEFFENFNIDAEDEIV